MTDITELVQSLKAAAENAIGAHERLAAYPYGEIIDISQHEGEQIDIDITDLNEFNKEANPVNILALVEALEKAQPAPAVMDDTKLRELFDPWFASDCSFGLPPEASEADNIAWRESYWYVWQRCRAAMLAAAPQSPGSEPATVPGKWIPVSEQMPEREIDVQVYCPDKKEQMVAYLERNELEGYFRFATWRTGDGIYCQPTHWMQLPAGPKEVKGE